jgi:hypothetical protein
MIPPLEVMKLLSLSLKEHEVVIETPATMKLSLSNTLSPISGGWTPYT